MSSIDELTRALSEITVARLIAIPHDEARVRYPLSFNTVSNYRGFENAISDYTIYHYGACIIPGARFPRYEALGIGKRIIEQAYRRRGSDIAGAFADARDGTNGGLRGVLDVIADGLKAQSIAHYATDQFDSRVAPVDFEAKVEIIRQFIQRFGNLLGDDIVSNRPERYASNYRELIEAYVSGMRQVSSHARRL